MEGHTSLSTALVGTPHLELVHPIIRCASGMFELLFSFELAVPTWVEKCRFQVY